MKIGILGGGQLGRMFIQNALKYDDEFYTLDPDKDCPCADISKFTQGSFTDYDTVFSFGKDKDILTIEIENVNADALAVLEESGVTVIPNAAAVKTIQHKILQKEFYLKNKIPTPKFQTIQKKSELSFPLPFVQKADTGGYDGKGVQVIHNEDDLQKVWDIPSVIEELIDIEKELSVIISKNSTGETAFFPVTEMVADPRLNLLDFNICPAEIAADAAKQIEEISQKFIKAIHSPGLFCIELFLDKTGKIWVNETAPRLHNSGHLTQEGNGNSQFEQLYRTLKNLPPADVSSKKFSGMLNLVGEENHSGPASYEGLTEVLRRPDTFVHLYGKKQTKPGRKMGHINIVADSREELLVALSEVKKMVRVVSE